jgi:hypothetical protein
VPANIYPNLYQRLVADNDLDGYLQEINLGKNPDDPKELNNPIAVLKSMGGRDIPGLHGAAIVIRPQIDIWGYGDAMRIEAYKATDRIDELMLEGFTFSDGGATRKFRITNGWQDLPTTDPSTIHLMAQYEARYWSGGRISALTS